MSKLVRKLSVLLAVVIMAVSMAGVAFADDATYNIGIIQLVQHESLDLATQGFKDALTEKLGDKVTFDYQNAQGESTNCATIVNGFVADEVDLIMANATAALQAAANGTLTIPVLGTSITEYGAALDIADFTGVTGFNVSGASDLAPLDQQAAVVKDLVPDAKTVGILYCTGEPNSKYQVDTIEPIFVEMGYAVERCSFSDSNDIASVLQNAVATCDVIFVPTDNTAASNTEIIANVCLPAKVPVVAGEMSTCRAAGVATLSISYYDVGYATGEMAYEILVNGADIAAMPVQYPSKFVKMYNPAICAELGIAAPEGYEAIVTEPAA